MSQFHLLSVKSIEQETPEAVSVGFDVPPELESKFRFVAGQYLTLEKEIDGKKERRSYSISSTPDSGDLVVTVKEVANGVFSGWVNKKLKVGDQLNVFLPEGRFIFEPSPKGAKGYAAFAAGSGITPVMAILKTALETEPESRFVLIYGNKTPEQTIFYKDLLNLKEKYPDRFFVEFVYSRLKQEGKVQKFFKIKLFKSADSGVEEKHKPLYGRIGIETVEQMLDKKYRDFKFDAYYLCGPETMVEAVTGKLKSKGVEEDQILHELFVTSGANGEEVNVSGKTMLTVVLEDEEVTFEMDRNTRVLDAIMEEGLDPPYSCRGGICSSCLAQIEEGKAKMAHNMILTDREVAAGLTLTCQAHPTTPTLKVNYDDI